MKFDLSPVIREKTTKRFDAELSFDKIHVMGSDYPVLKKEPFEVTVSCEDGKNLSIHAETEITADVPCDRCLESVSVPVSGVADCVLPVSDGKIVWNPEEGPENFIDGTDLDCDRLMMEEFLLNWPSKVLCKEDCKGLCPICGQNLNVKECGCDRASLDPRMARFLDVFHQFKEV